MTGPASPAGLVLVAAGGLAAEVADAALAGGRDVVGLVDDDPALWGTTVVGLPVLGGLAAVAEHPDAELVLCAGRGTVREVLRRRLDIDLGRAGDFATVIHPSVRVPASCSIGPGTVILAGCVMTARVDVGQHVVCMPNVVLTHDDVLEDYVTVCAGSVLGGHVRVRRTAFLGMSCSIREHAQIGSGAVVGMGAVVLGDVPPGETWCGVPARRRTQNASSPGQTRET